MVLSLLVGYSVTAGNGAIDTSGIALVKSGMAIKVFYLAKVNRYAKVAILDRRGNRVFYDIVRSKSGFIRSYNISHLMSGEYVVRVTDSGGAHTLTFEIADQAAITFRQPD